MRTEQISELSRKMALFDRNLEIFPDFESPLTPSGSRVEAKERITGKSKEKFQAFIASNNLESSEFYLSALALLLWRYSKKQKIYIKSVESNIEFSFPKGKSFLSFQRNPTSRRLASERNTDEDANVEFNHHKELSDSSDANLPPIHFTVVEGKDEIELCLSLDADLYLEDRAQMFLQHYVNFILGGIEVPEADIVQIPFLTHDEEEKICFEFNKPISQGVQPNFLQLFSKHVIDHGERIAVEDESNALTYEQLDIRSSQLADHLMDRGVVSGDVIGMAIGDCVHYAVCIVAIMKLQGTYLPLDLSYTPSLLNRMMSEAQPRFIIANRKGFDLLRDYKTEFVFLEEEIWQRKTRSSWVEPNSFDESSAAYISYSSGSTGAPKGIVVPYHSLRNICLARTVEYPRKMRALGSGRICFDTIILATFRSLSSGGSIYVVNQREESNLKNIAQIIHSKNINYTILLPLQYSEILSYFESYPQLECVSLTGEHLPASLVELHVSKSPNAKLLNEYGPSEYAIGSSISVVYCPEKKEVGTITAGKPIRDTNVFVLDENEKLVPIGVKGEIYVCGVGLARGYLNNKKLTNEKFRLVNLASLGLTRMFKTGDKGRFLADGQLQFLGRIESTALRKGVQVDFGEIEHKLSLHPDLQRVVVLEDEEQEELVVFFESKRDLCKNELEGHIRKNLFSKISPDKYVSMSSFPESPNGKVDRKELVLRYKSNAV